MDSIHMPKGSRNQVKSASKAIKKGLYGQHTDLAEFTVLCCWLYCILLFQPFLILSSKGNVWNFIFNLFGMPHRLLKLIWSPIRSKKGHYQIGRKLPYIQFPNLFLLFNLGNYLYFWVCIYLFTGQISLGKFLFYYFHCKLINS